MWEVLLRAPRGSYSPRKFSMLLATFLVACFGYMLAGTTPVSAADTSWDGDNIIYGGNTYEPTTPTTIVPKDIPDGSAIYRYVDESKDPDLAHFIYFSKGTKNPKSAKEATYIRYSVSPPNIYSNPTGKKTISLKPSEDPQAPNTDENPISDSCTIKGIGWIVCPVMQGVSEGMDYIFEKIRGFLVVQPLSLSVDNPVYRVWQYSRDIANIAFIIGFMVIIYSYLVGGGFSGYEMRKIIPRLVVAAVLINVSYLICSAAVDISNISGYGVNQLFESVRDQVLSGSSRAGAVNWTSVTTWVLAGGTGAVAAGLVLPGLVGGAAGLWLMLATFLFGAALVILVTFLILAARQAIIVVLIVIAPLAFAAFILPNTEKWFERWRSLFFNMLVMFPAFAAVFGGAQLAGELIIRTATSIEQIILGLGVMIAPLAITPLLLRLSGGVLNRVGGIINNRQKGLYDRYKNFNNDRRADLVAANQRLNAERRRDGNFGRGPRGLVQRRAAFNYAKKNYRETQRKEDETAAENAWHNQSGRWGYNNHDNRGEVRSRYLNRRQDGYGNLDRYKRQNALYHDATEKHHEEHWQDYLQSTPGAGYRAMQTESRLAEGRAKVMSGAMEAEDERQLRTALLQGATPRYADLRAQQVQATVDSGYAEAMKTRLDTEGQLTFKQEFTGSGDAARALRRAFNEGTAMKKEIGEIDTILEKRADAYWQRTSQADDRVRNLRLQAVEATDSASKYEEQWNKLIANIRAEGASAPNITLNADKSIAGNIKRLGMDVQYEKFGQEAAQRVAQANMSATLKANDAIRAYAGGIGGESAANRIYAKARKDIVGAYIEDVENSRSVLSEYSLVELMRLHQEGIDRDNNSVVDNDAMRDAAMREIVLSKGNNWSYQKTKDFVSGLGMNYDESTNEYYEVVRDADGYIQKDAKGQPVKGAVIRNQDEIDRRRDIQQLFVDSAKNSKLKIASFSGTDRGNAEAGTFFIDGKEAIIRDINDKKINATRLAGTDVDELQRMIQLLREGGNRNRLDAGARNSLINTIEYALTDPQTRANIGDREAELMQVISYYVGDNRSDIPMDDRVAYETYAKTKAPTKYKSDRVNDYGDGKGPDENHSL